MKCTHRCLFCRSKDIANTTSFCDVFVGVSNTTGAIEKTWGAECSENTMRIDTLCKQLSNDPLEIFIIVDEYITRNEQRK